MARAVGNLSTRPARLFLEHYTSSSSSDTTLTITFLFLSLK
jgi:hypothetical protein